MKGLLIHVCMGSPFWHVIKLGTETGNEMKQNEINLQCSDGYSLQYSLHNNSAYFHRLNAYKWHDLQRSVMTLTI